LKRVLKSCLVNNYFLFMLIGTEEKNHQKQTGKNLLIKTREE